MGLADCFSRSWDSARVILDDKDPAGMVLDRPYAQVDRFRLKSKLMRAAHDSGCEFLVGKASEVEHEERLSSLLVKGERLFARAVLVRPEPARNGASSAPKPPPPPGVAPLRLSCHCGGAARAGAESTLSMRGADGASAGLPRRTRLATRGAL